MRSLNNKKYRAAACLLLLLMTIAVYGQVGGFAFLDWDDTVYVTENRVVQAGLTADGVAWAFSTFHAANWHPLTWLSHMLDVTLFGMDAGWHHLSNLLLHLVNTLLLFLVLNRMTGLPGRSLFVAALFALHPLHVESVAWVAERKDLLSAFFGILTIGFYAGYVRRPGIGRYLPVWLLFAMGLLAKPMLVTLPLLLLLLDYWPLKRFPVRYPADANRAGPGQPVPVVRLVLEKIPLLALAAASSVITFIAQERGGAVTGPYDAMAAHGATASFAVDFGWGERMANALVSYASYLGKLFYPAALSFFYPFRQSVEPGVLAVAAFVVLVISLAAILWWRRKPWLFVGWFWFAGMLFPVSGVVLVGWQSMADRYTYLPLVGLLIAIAWGLPDLLRKWAGGARVLAFAAVLSILACAALSYRQTGYWRDDLSLYRHAVVATPESAFAHFKLGTALAEQGDYHAAVTHLEAAVRIQPFDLRARFNLGLALLRLEQFEKAIGHFRKLLERYPGYGAAERQIEIARSMQRRRQAASESAGRYLQQGLWLERQGRAREAMRLYQQLLRYRPESLQAHQRLGFLFHQLRRFDEAIRHYRAALRLRPDSAALHYNLGLALAGNQQLDESIEQYRQALRIQPDRAEVHNNLGVALSRKGLTGQAIAHFEKALQLRPGYAQAKGNLARLTRSPANGE